MKHLRFIIIIFGLVTGHLPFSQNAYSADEETPPPTPEVKNRDTESKESKPAPQKIEKAKANASATDEKEIDVSDLAEEYWRPQRDELEVVQNKKFKKARHIEASLLYGFFQTNQYSDSYGMGSAITYNLTERWGIEASYLKVTSRKSAFLEAVNKQYNFNPQFNEEDNQKMGIITWTPIYAKFAFLGKKISHYDFYVGIGAGSTRTRENHFTKGFVIGNRFFIYKGLVLRGEFRIVSYTDKIYVTQGTAAVANGGPGYTLDDIVRRNLIVGVGWLF